MEITDTVWAGMDAIPTADTGFAVYQDHPIIGFECGAYGTDLDAGWVITLITELWYKKTA
mgnify:CR=1 FL=1